MSSILQPNDELDDYFIPEMELQETKATIVSNSFTKVKTKTTVKTGKQEIRQEQEVCKKRKKIEATAIQPKEAIRNVRLLIDYRLKLIDKQGHLLQSIKDNCAAVAVQDDEMLPVENCICWSRRDPHDSEIYHMEREYCVILLAVKLLDLIDHDNDDALFKYVSEIRTRIPVNSLLIFIVVGAERQKNQRMKQAVFDTSLRTGAAFHYEPDFASLGLHVADLSKSVAEKLYKKRKQILQDCLSFAPSDQKPSTKLTESGENANHCWRRMLQVMAGSKPNAENAAKSIAAVYKCPEALLHAYSEQLSTERCELLLAGLVADNLTKVRVGPSISCCVYRSLMLDDPEVTVDKPKI